MLEERLQYYGGTLEGDGERVAIQDMIRRLRDGASSASGKAIVGVQQSRKIIAFWGMPSLIVMFANVFSPMVLGLPWPSNCPVCIVPCAWHGCCRCTGGYCGNEDVRPDGCRYTGLCLYFGSLVFVLADVLFSIVMVLLIAPLLFGIAIAFDLLGMLLSLIFVWGFMTLGRQGWYPFQETVEIWLLDGYSRASTVESKVNRNTWANMGVANLMTYELVLSKKNDVGCAKMCCTSRMCYHPMENIVSDDMCITAYAYGDAADANLSARDVRYFRQAHLQLRATWETAMVTRPGQQVVV